MNKRPVPITLICLFLAISISTSFISSIVGFFSLTTEVVISENQFSVYTKYLFGFLGHIAILLSAIAMYMGKNWGRYLYVSWGATALTVQFLFLDAVVVLIPGLVVYLLITLLLYNKKSNEYFKKFYIDKQKSS